MEEYMGWDVPNQAFTLKNKSYFIGRFTELKDGGFVVEEDCLFLNDVVVSIHETSDDRLKEIITFLNLSMDARGGTLSKEGLGKIVDELRTKWNEGGDPGNNDQDPYNEDTDQEPDVDQEIREEHTEEIVKTLLGGENYFSKRSWRSTVSFTLPVGLCESSDGFIFRNTVKGDMEKAVPRKMPQMVQSDGPYRSSYSRQVGPYSLLKKVLVGVDGQIYHATDQEISQALQGVSGDEGLGDMTADEYVFGVKKMFDLRG